MEDHQKTPSGSNSASSSSTSPSSSDSHFRLPSTHLLNKDNWTTCNGLYHAALRGDWEMYTKIIEKDPQNRSATVNAAITSSTMETAHHVAAGAKNIEFVEKLHAMKEIDWTLQDRKGNTAFCSAVAGGATEIVNKFLSLPTWRNFLTGRGGQNITPLYLASSFGNGEIASKLYRVSKDYNINILEVAERYGLFFNFIYNDLYDLAIKMLDEETVDGGLVQTRDRNEYTALHVLSQKDPSVFENDQNRGIWSLISSKFSSELPIEPPALTLVKKLWKRVLEQNEYDYFTIRRLIDSPFNFVTEATKEGNYHFLVEVVSFYPESIWVADKTGHTIFHYAIQNRHVKIFKLIHETGLAKRLIETFEDNEGNNILHLAAKIPSQSRLNNVSGAALQMRQEILWFEEVKKIVAPFLKSKRNHNQQTPQDLFTKEHMDLERDAEEWMKQNAKTCLLVATIIVTVIFQAAFDVFDGQNNNSGNRKPIILSISNAIAMSFSSTAIILFLSVLISRFTENELFWSLPCSFIGGLLSLFLSVTSMMVSFCVTSFIPNGPSAVPIFTISLQVVPITLFVYLVYPVLRDIVHATFFFKSDFKAEERILHYCEV